MSPDEFTQERLLQLEAECARLRQENAILRAKLDPAPPPSPAAVPAIRFKPDPTGVNSDSSPAQKIALYRRLFRGRDDVYAVRWIGKDGKAGYSPASLRDWSERDDLGRPKRTLISLTDEAIQDHLTGKQTIGVYPLLQDETCYFLAADFDKEGWQKDATAFLKTCADCNIPATLERSRSGKGGHVWIFFEQAIPSVLARKMGTALLTRTMEARHQIGLDSYDRLFPNQDTMPKGGFGNLIALPLQAGPRRDGNSVFVTSDFHQHSDQWAFLSSVPLVTQEQVESIVGAAERTGTLIGLRPVPFDDEDPAEDPWLQAPSKRKMETPISEPLPQEVRVLRGNLVFVEKAGLPSAMLNRLLRIAAFQNPEFYRAQGMRLSTFGKPRVIRCGEEFAQFIGLPRGSFEETLSLLKAHNIKPIIQDERFGGVPLNTLFHGTLYPEQELALQSLILHDEGVLSATTAFGKTVIAARMIAERGVNTLVLVHRRQLLDQWRERLALFLGMSPREIGVISGGKKALGKRVDVAVIQSLSRNGEVHDLVAEYGQVIVDECHHLSAFSFEQILRQVKAKYVLGLTATPIRKDGHHPIIFMQCGPIRFRVDPRRHAALRPFQHVVIPRATVFQLPPSPQAPPIQELYRLLADNPRRNAQIVEDVLNAVKAGRSPILLTERTSHADWFATALQDKVKNVVVLKGGQGVKQRRAAAAHLESIAEASERVIVATGRYIGEGFDDSRLDTLFLALPVSWRGTLQQYVGRLHRLHAGKIEVRVYDYIDGAIPMLSNMFLKRRRGYEAVGYTIRDDSQLPL